jgi:pimeloyl-ACP methyl ester carboxylesterase
MTITQLSEARLVLPSGYEVAYREAGQRSANRTTLVFLHGFMGSSQCWRSLLPLLQDQYHCLSLDLLGFGQSAKPAIRYDIATLVEFVRQFARAMHLPRFTLVGHSLGGWVAAAYALACEDQVDALILLAPAGIRDDSFCGRYTFLRPLLWQTSLVDGVLRLGQPLASLMGQGESWQTIRFYRRELNAQPAARSFLGDRLRPEDAIDTVENEIHRIQVPTLVVAGEQDTTIPLWHCETYGRGIPQAHLIVIPDADHQLPQRYASAIADPLRQFLDSLVSSESWIIFPEGRECGTILHLDNS